MSARPALRLLALLLAWLKKRQDFGTAKCSKGQLLTDCRVHSQLASAEGL